MWACSGTTSYWKGSLAVFNWKCPLFLVPSSQNSFRIGSDGALLLGELCHKGTVLVPCLVKRTPLSKTIPQGHCFGSIFFLSVPADAWLKYVRGCCFTRRSLKLCFCGKTIHPSVLSFLLQTLWRVSDILQRILFQSSNKIWQCRKCIKIRQWLLTKDLISAAANLSEIQYTDMTNRMPMVHPLQEYTYFTM